MSYIPMIVFFVLCIGASGQPAFGQPMPPVATQWKQSIERRYTDWDYDGKRILGHVDEDICLWDAVTGQLLHRLKGHQERIHKVQFSPDGKHALSSSWIESGPMTNSKSEDTRTILWDLATGQRKHVLPGQVAGEFSPDGTRFITYSETEEVTSFDAAVWDVLTGRELVKVKLDRYSDPKFHRLHFSPDGTRFVNFRHQGGAVLYDSNDGRQLGGVSFNNGIHRYTSTGALAYFDLVREMGRGKISHFDIVSGQPLRSFEQYLDGFLDGAWSHDGRKFAGFPFDGAIKIWDFESGTAITGDRGRKFHQHFVIVSPGNSRLAATWGGGPVGNKEVDPEFGLYDMQTGAEIAVIGHSRSARLIGFSPDSKTVLVVSSKFEIYNSVDGKVIRSLTVGPVANP